MFSTKKNVLQVVALLKAFNVQHVVLSPGSRNAPLIQTFTQDSFFKCHTIVDERNAGFYAIGIIQSQRQPVAICCTSGSALLNYAPAVSEAFYQQLPLIVVSGDRAPAWIGQMDGQTLPQDHVFGSLVKKSVHLPEIQTEVDEWHCNRLINEALLSCSTQDPGPVHINVPLSEPLFDYSEPQLPEVRRIERIANDQGTLAAEQLKALQHIWNSASKKLILVGQSFYSAERIVLLEQLVKQEGCVVLCEQLANCPSPHFVSNFDAVLQSLSSPADQACKDQLAPDLLITFGGHVVSKRVKHFLRAAKPKHHWHISLSGAVVDLFQVLTQAIQADPEAVLEPMLADSNGVEAEGTYYNEWRKISRHLPQPSRELPFSDIWAVGELLRVLPDDAALQIANSSALRITQMFQLNPTARVYCNRGVNGIEGSLPSAVGFAAVHQGIVYLLIGDLSYFYALSALWDIKHLKNLRILLINNGGGSIFHQLPGLNQSASLNKYVAASHHQIGQEWGEAAGFKCLMAEDKATFNEHLQTFIDDKIEHNILLEICTDTVVNKQVNQQYDQQLKVKN